MRALTVLAALSRRWMPFSVLSPMPDRDHAQRALQKVGLRVHQDIVLNTSTLLDAEEAVLVLPAQPEWQIPCLIGLALEPHREDLFGCMNTAEIRDEMAKLIPMYAGIETLKEDGDFVQWGGPQLGGSTFGTDDGKAAFSRVAIPRVDVPKGSLLLSMLDHAMPLAKTTLVSVVAQVSRSCKRLSVPVLLLWWVCLRLVHWRRRLVRCWLGLPARAHSTHIRSGTGSVNKVCHDFGQRGSVHNKKPFIAANGATEVSVFAHRCSGR